ncbi:MAG: phytanoyl-CoA dioxygenase family protein, partial [Planctomycetales bacterium]
MTEDLSRKHCPITDLFPKAPSRADEDSFRLTEEQTAFFQENGYLSGVKILTDEQADLLCDELETLADPKHPGHELFYEFHANESSDPSQVLFHALGAWRITPGFHDLLWHPGVLLPASQLLEGGVRFWHDQLFCKPPHHGGVVAWHQDFSYWTRTQPMAHLTCWIGLDRTDRDNGCLHYVPGSHRWDLLPITG